MQWWPIAKNLAQYLQGRTGLSSFDIYAGTKGKDRTYPCIEVVWDDESGFSIYKNREGVVALWVDSYVRSENVAPGIAYEQQYMAQVEILAALLEWPEKVFASLGIAGKVSVEGVVSDGESRRPIFGNRMIIKFEWKK